MIEVRYNERKKSDIYVDVSECVLHFKDGRKKTISNPDQNILLTVSVAPRMKKNAGFVELVLQHHTTSASVEILSARCGFKSTRTFTRHFHKHFQTTPKQWLMSVKKRELIHLLKNTNLSLVAIANRLGFVDASHLHNFCVRRTGLTPSEIREE